MVDLNWIHELERLPPQCILTVRMGRGKTQDVLETSVYLSVTGQTLRLWIFNPNLVVWDMKYLWWPPAYTYIVFSDLFLKFPHLEILIIGARIRAFAWDLTV